MFDKMRGRKPMLIGMETYRRSAVVIPLIQKEDGLHVVFEMRAIELRHQPGEICFPGGRCEVGEEGARGALREICEELLISEEQIELIAPMDVFVSPFNMMIYPYLGILKDYEGTFNPDEVFEVFTVPLSYFMAHEPAVYYNKVCVEPPEDFPWDKVHGGRDYRWSEGEYSVYFYEYEQWIIWGITARIMDNTIRQLKAAGYGGAYGEED